MAMAKEMPTQTTCIYRKTLRRVWCWWIRLRGCGVCVCLCVFVSIHKRLASILSVSFRWAANLAHVELLSHNAETTTTTMTLSWSYELWLRAGKMVYLQNILPSTNQIHSQQKTLDKNSRISIPYNIIRRKSKEVLYQLLHCLYKHRDMIWAHSKNLKHISAHSHSLKQSKD